jgi:transposase
MLNEVIVGIDAAKSKFDVHVSPWGKRFSCPTTKAGLRLLSSRLSRTNPSLVVLEATGGYEFPIASALFKAGLPVSVVNPRRIRDHAKSIGKLAKTDSIDAAVIADYGTAHRQHCRPFKLREEQALKEVVARRGQLVAERTAEMNRLKQATNPVVVKSIRKNITNLTQDIKELAREIAKLIRENQSWRRRQEILTSHCGVGAVTSSVLIGMLPEMGEANRHQVAALAGVAPFNNDSGQKQGHKSISCGRPAVRTALYMATLTATRRKGVISEFYQRLIKKGKPRKVALTACMRKLLTILNAMIATDTTWRPKNT